MYNVNIVKLGQNGKEEYINEETNCKSADGIVVYYIDANGTSFSTPFHIFLGGKKTYQANIFSTNSL